MQPVQLYSAAASLKCGLKLNGLIGDQRPAADGRVGIDLLYAACEAHETRPMACVEESLVARSS
jgi:hypothetical protein